MSKPVKIGLFGGAGGQPRDIIHTPTRLVRVVVYSGEAINSIEFTYMDSSGNLHDDSKWGGSGGHKQPPLELDENSEYVKEISGTFGPWDNNVRQVVTSLKFVTNKGATYEYGQTGSGGSFHVPVDDGQITGFFGRVGDLIDAIGVYVLP